MRKELIFKIRTAKTHEEVKRILVAEGVELTNEEIKEINPNIACGVLITAADGVIRDNLIGPPACNGTDDQEVESNCRNSNGSLLLG